MITVKDLWTCAQNQTVSNDSRDPIVQNQGPHCCPIYIRVKGTGQTMMKNKKSQKIHERQLHHLRPGCVNESTSTVVFELKNHQLPSIYVDSPAKLRRFFTRPKRKARKVPENFPTVTPFEVEKLCPRQNIEFGTLKTSGIEWSCIQGQCWLCSTKKSHWQSYQLNFSTNCWSILALH